MPLSSSMARIPLSPYSFSAAGRSADNSPKPRNPAADAASIRSRRFSGLRRSARSEAASPALLQHVASRRSFDVLDDMCYSVIRSRISAMVTGRCSANDNVAASATQLVSSSAPATGTTATVEAMRPIEKSYADS